MTIECGAHDCLNVDTFNSIHDANEAGWHYDQRGGYGWICPECFEPVSEQAALRAWEENPDNPENWVEAEQ